MKSCHTLVKCKQLFKGKPSFQIGSSVRFNRIKKKIIKFGTISFSSSLQERAEEGCTWNAKGAWCLLVLRECKARPWLLQSVIKGHSLPREMGN